MLVSGLGVGHPDAALGTQSGAVGVHTGENGSASPMASMIGCSRSTVSVPPSRPTRGTSSSSVVASVVLSG